MKPPVTKINCSLLGSNNFLCLYYCLCRSQWPRGLRRRSAAACLLRLWVQITPGAWKSVCCECCVLSGRVLCVGLITRPEESYRVWCVVMCDLETSWMRRPWPTGGLLRGKKKKKNLPLAQNVKPQIHIIQNIIRRLLCALKTSVKSWSLEANIWRNKVIY